jgi:hypothetical protein
VAASDLNPAVEIETVHGEVEKGRGADADVHDL